MGGGGNGGVGVIGGGEDERDRDISRGGQESHGSLTRSVRDKLGSVS